MAVSLPEAKNIPNVAAPEGQDTGFFGMLSELSWVEWALIAVGVLLLVLVIALVVRFFVRRARMNKLAGTMREDLLLRRSWRNASGTGFPFTAALLVILSSTHWRVLYAMDILKNTSIGCAIITAVKGISFCRLLPTAACLPTLYCSRMRDCISC